MGRSQVVLQAALFTWLHISLLAIRGITQCTATVTAAPNTIETQTDQSQ